MEKLSRVSKGIGTVGAWLGICLLFYIASVSGIREDHMFQYALFAGAATSYFIWVWA